ncbi:hypothetical protein MNEG_0198 [Monoraphidium neglectum]|uniref:Uncharacterized protein n=1 Tax=Monoraphidium neglectum TaxID=145388 RepID=A0A0D2KCG3_9CHLO|nr:hypothetical protein MNEG_0198 [Monoraphidium neglectum]KIZ07753.1 hypothetical protein MNEG_0198 [Monoraphidium neglectum]|eukprot:XP_013906772.1 hypothetical protein MNEG_0198 [Monoraphidium neglectum]
MQKQQQRRVAPRPGEHGGGADAAPAAGADEALQVLHSVEAPARASADAAAAQRPKLLPEEGCLSLAWAAYQDEIDHGRGQPECHQQHQQSFQEMQQRLQQLRRQEEQRQQQHREQQLLREQQREQHREHQLLLREQQVLREQQQQRERAQRAQQQLDELMLERRRLEEQLRPSLGSTGGVNGSLRADGGGNGRSEGTGNPASETKEQATVDKTKTTDKNHLPAGEGEPSLAEAPRPRLGLGAAPPPLQTAAGGKVAPPDRLGGPTSKAASVAAAPMNPSQAAEEGTGALVPGAPVPDWATDARHNAPRWLEDSLKQYEAQGRIGRDPLASFRTSMEELACKIPIDKASGKPAIDQETLDFFDALFAARYTKSGGEALLLKKQRQLAAAPKVGANCALRRGLLKRGIAALRAALERERGEAKRAARREAERTQQPATPKPERPRLPAPLRGGVGLAAPAEPEVAHVLSLAAALAAAAAADAAAAVARGEAPPPPHESESAAPPAAAPGAAAPAAAAAASHGCCGGGKVACFEGCGAATPCVEGRAIAEGEARFLISCSQRACRGARAHESCYRRSCLADDTKAAAKCASKCGRRAAAAPPRCPRQGCGGLVSEVVHRRAGGRTQTVFELEKGLLMAGAVAGAAAVGQCGQLTEEKAHEQEREQEQEQEQQQEQEQEQVQGHQELLGGAGGASAGPMTGLRARGAGEAVLLGSAAAADGGSPGPKLIRVLRRAASPDAPRGGGDCGDACGSGAVDVAASQAPAAD